MSRILRSPVGDTLLVAYIVLFAVMFAPSPSHTAIPLAYANDSGYYLSLITAYHYPEYFSQDPILSDPANYNWDLYFIFQALGVIEPLVGSMSYALYAMAVPLIALTAAGMYLLGRAVLENRLWAAVFAMTAATLPMAQTFVGEYWGWYGVPLPRVYFQAAFPFLLVLALHWCNRPGRWLWLMVLSGVSISLHPLSAPPVGFALWLALWLNLPPGWSIWRKIGVMVGLGLVYMVVLVPFLYNFYGQFDSTSTVEETVARDVVLRASSAYTDTVNFYNHVLRSLTGTRLIALSVVGMAVGLANARTRNIAAQILTWISGILFVVFVLHWLDLTLSLRIDRIPPEMQLIRSYRYAVPLLILFSVWAVMWFVRQYVAYVPANGVAAALLLVFPVVLPVAYGELVQFRGSCTFYMGMTCPDEADRHLIDMYDYIRESTPEDALIFPQRSGYAGVRHYARRSLAIDREDANIYFTRDQASYARWQQTLRILDNINDLPDSNRRLQRLITLATDYNADYLLVENNTLTDEAAVNIVYRNPGFALIALERNTTQ